MTKKKKKKKKQTINTNLVGLRAHMLKQMPKDPHSAEYRACDKVHGEGYSMGVPNDWAELPVTIVNVYMLDGEPYYTVADDKGRMLETSSSLFQLGPMLGVTRPQQSSELQEALRQLYSATEEEINKYGVERSHQRIRESR